MSRLLGPGATGIDVRELQIALNLQLASGACRLNVDGKYGSATQNAVRVFQRRAGLVPDGLFGDRTRGNLFTSFTTLLTITPRTVAPTSSQTPPSRSAPPTPVQSSPTPSSTTTPNSSDPPAPTGRRGWDNLQLAPGAQHTFRPWVYTPDPTNPGRPDPFFSATFAISGTYRWFNRDPSQNWTRDGAHLEISPGLQFGYNTAYTLPYRGGTLPPWNVQASVTFTYADFLVHDRFHFSPFAQINGAVGPGSVALGAGVGGQFSFDLVRDHLAFFAQGGGAATIDPRSGSVQVGPGVIGGLIWTLYPRGRTPATTR